MHIVRIDPKTDPIWKRLIDRNESSIFHSPEWLRVLTDTYGFDVQAYVVVDDTGQPTAGIPFCRISDFIGKRIVSLPFSDFCDPLVNDIDQWNGLIDSLQVERAPVILRCLHNDLPLADERFTVVKRAKWHALDLQPDPETLWQGLHSSAQRAVRKAKRDGVVVEITQQKEALRAFFDMHLGVRKYKYRLLAQPFHFFENIWRHLIEKQRGFLLVARYQGEIIGGVMYLHWQNTLYYKFNASCPDSLAYRPNDLLIWEGIQYAKAKGCARLDFGLSDWDQAGLVRYKRKFATEEKAISYLQHVPDGASSRMKNGVWTLLGQLTNLLTDESVPDPVTEKAGEVLYRYFC